MGLQNKIVKSTVVRDDDDSQRTLLFYSASSPAARIKCWQLMFSADHRRVNIRTCQWTCHIIFTLHVYGLTFVSWWWRCHALGSWFHYVLFYLVVLSSMCPVLLFPSLSLAFPAFFSCAPVFHLSKGQCVVLEKKFKFLHYIHWWGNDTNPDFYFYFLQLNKQVVLRGK